MYGYWQIETEIETEIEIEEMGKKIWDNEELGMVVRRLKIIERREFLFFKVKEALINSQSQIS